MSEILALDIGGTKVGWAVVRYFADAQHLEARELQDEHAAAVAVNTNETAFAGRTPDFEIVADGSIKTLAMDGGAQVLARIVALAQEIKTQYPEIRGVSVASAGVVDPASGAIISATGTMPGWGGTALGAALREATGLPVEVINDVHAHGLGEARLGAGKGNSVVLSLAVGTGIGGALIRQGEIDFGNHFLAGHFGHIHHSYAAGMECSCGRSGHIEAISSGSGITSWYNARARTTSSTLKNPPVQDGRQLQELADGGNKLAKKCFRESAK